jgi:hypothetical protein
MATDDLGNQQVAFEWGNFPMQPNNDRTNLEINREGEDNYTSNQSTPPELGEGDSHVINAISWNQYPEFKGSRNYPVTAAEYLGDNVYEFTSYNELKVGDEVRTTNCAGFNGVATVVYADHTKFRTENEHEGSTKVTGLRGRVDVLEPYDVGHTRYEGEGDKVFLWPSYGFCYNSFNSGDGKWQDMIEYLRSAGVAPERLVEATFTGGENKYDYSGDAEYNGGVIFWDYIPANEIIYVDWQTAEVITGKDLDGYVISSSNSWGSSVLVNPESDLDISFVAFTNDPAKNDTATWWY